MKASRALPAALACAPMFCVLAIANSAGYRYGVSDLAFYLPAAFHDLDPRLFPRDGALLDVQARFTLADEWIAWAMRVGRLAGLTDPSTVYALHVATLLLLFAGAVALGRAAFRSGWSVAAFVAALTLRHAVARTGVNTLEGYFHPRVLAFAIGVVALAAFVRRGPGPALAASIVACTIHTTTGFWFLTFVGVAGLVSDRRWRPGLLAMGAAGVLLLAYAVTLGPLAGRLHAMDDAWLRVIAEKDYLFPDEWPLEAWLMCAVYPILIGAAALVRTRRGALDGRERGLLAGAAAMLVIFLVAVPLLAARSALAIQLQPSRVFWMLDLLATMSVIWLAESGRPRATASAVLAVALVVASTARGVYLMTVQFRERTVFAAAPPPSPWQDVMRWARTTDPSSHWLAHPNHAFMYGSSIRVAGMRDVFIEAAKDPAVAMYDRGVAMRVAERLPLVSDFDALTAGTALALARRYDLDYLVTERTLPLPVAFAHPPLVVYRLQSGPAAADRLH